MGKSGDKKKADLPRRAAARLPKFKRKASARDAVATDTVLERLYATVQNRRDADPAVSHSARLMSRGIAKVAQKFGEEAVECLIEAVAGNHDALIAESADVLYHLLVLWVASGVRPEDVWQELARREGVSGIVERASRPAKRLPLAMRVNTSKIP